MDTIVGLRGKGSGAKEIGTGIKHECYTNTLFSRVSFHGEECGKSRYIYIFGARMDSIKVNFKVTKDNRRTVCFF